MFSGSAPRLHPLFSGGYWARLDDGGEPRWRSIYSPVGFLLTVCDDLVPALAIFIQFQLEEEIVSN